VLDPLRERSRPLVGKPRHTPSYSKNFWQISTHPLQTNLLNKSLADPAYLV
jgi:hypothetical protein